ncbi:MAG: hypothetical protein ACOYLS_00640 [Polymorphobacter sp.]
MATGDIIAFQIMDASALPGGGTIDGNGVIARIRLEGLAGNIGGAFDLSKLTGSGARPGWNRARVFSSANIISDVALTAKIARRPFPNEALRIEAVAGADLDIYAFLAEEWFVGDTLLSVAIAPGFYAGSNASTLAGAGLTNSSTRAYRMPQFSWVGLEPWRRMTAAGLTVEAVVDHHNARDAQPVAAVDFTVARLGTTSTATASSMALSNEVTAPYRPGVFRGLVPMGALSQGEGELSAVIYPWVGTAAWDTNSANFESFPCVGTPKLLPVTIDSDGSYAPAGAYVSHTGAVIGSPSIGLVSAMAPYVPGTTPAYATIAAVMNAARAYNNSAGNRARVHDDMAAVFAVIPSGTIVGDWGAALSSQTTYPPGTGYCGITIEAGASRAFTGLTTNTRLHASRFMVSGCGIFPGVSGVAHTVVDSGNAPTTQPTRAAAVQLVVRNCSGTGANNNTNAVFSRLCYRYFRGNSFTSFGDDVIASNAANFAGYVHVHGCDIDNDANSVGAPCQSPSIIGSRLKSVQLIGLAAGAAPDVLGRMVHNVRVENNDDGSATFTTALIAQLGVRPIGVRGESWVNMLVRKTFPSGTPGVLSGGESPAFQVSSDFAAGPVDQPAVTNINMAYCSFAGARRNGPYQEAASARVLKEVREIGIAASQWNAKADLFTGAGGASGNRTGTFAYRHGTARFGLVGGDNSANGAAPFTPASWLGDVLPPLSAMNVGYANMWAADTSLAGSNSYTAAGDYTPRSALFARIPAGRAATGFDLSGLARRNDGFGAAGAIERLVAVLAPGSARSLQQAGGTAAALTLPLAPRGARHGQRAARPAVGWAGAVAPAASRQGQAAARPALGWAATLLSAAARSDGAAGDSLVMPDAVARWLLPQGGGLALSGRSGRLLVGTAVVADRILVPGGDARTLSIN